MVEEAERCRAASEIGALLRREGVYSSHLTAWRKHYRAGARRATAYRWQRPHAEQWCTDFFTYDNTQHRHSGIAYCTPAMVHGGNAPAVLTQRHRTMERAFTQYPERFVHGAPTPSTLPAAVSINPRAEQQTAVVELSKVAALSAHCC